jgi:BirA family transcriptional regulator, biotin operon repressor / biotin---[acetyl-CoA-carboxylase] ligase
LARGGGGPSPSRFHALAPPQTPGRPKIPNRTLTLGRPRVHLRETDSTNDRARELADAGAPHGTLVTASSQRAGRGRQGRSWSAPANSSLLMSLLLRPGSQGGMPPPPPPGLLPLIAAVAVCDVAGEDALIKWPNDIMLVRSDVRSDGWAGIRSSVRSNDRPLGKLAGILAEGRPQAGWAVLGIGLNVAVRIEELPIELRAGAATLGCGRDAIEPTLERLLAALAHRLAAPTAQTLDAWRSRDALRGRKITWNSGRGRAQGIDAAGHLLVELDGGGQVALDAGEVHLRPVG